MTSLSCLTDVEKQLSLSTELISTMQLYANSSNDSISFEWIEKRRWSSEPTGGDDAALFIYLIKDMLTVIDKQTTI